MVFLRLRKEEKYATMAMMTESSKPTDEMQNGQENVQ
jgi:hypothetical protein